MVKVTFNTGRYIEELAKRMVKVGLSQAQLGREMDPPVSPTQVTRWFTENEDRRRQPSLQTIERVEVVMAKYERRAARKESE